MTFGNERGIVCGMKKTDARALPSAAQEDLRRKVVQAVQEGLAQQAAARLFGVHRGTVNRWLRLYREGGTRALRPKKRGRPPVARLRPHQAALAVRLIAGRCPNQLRLPFALWTREAVALLLAKRFKLRVSVWTAGRYLKRWGFSPQKPLRRAYERNPEAVQRWLDEEYPAIQRAAQAGQAEIHWGDEMGLRSDHQAGTSWGRRGQTPVVTGTGRRFRCQMLSTITNRGTLCFMVFEERFRAPVLIRFLRRLLRQRRRKLFVILDNHPVHVSAQVQRWVAQRAPQLRLFFLPAYSPELNPDELLNQDAKTNAVGGRRPRDQAELEANVRGYLRSTQRMPHVVRAYFQKEQVRYAS